MSAARIPLLDLSLQHAAVADEVAAGFAGGGVAGAVGGDAVKAYYLYKETGQGGSSLGSVFLDRYVGYLALLAATHFFRAYRWKNRKPFHNLLAS